jgi:hypothetical protein
VSSSGFTQECQDAVIHVFKSLSARIIKHLPSRNFVTCEWQFTTLQSMLSGMANDLGATPFALEVTDEDDTDKKPLTASAILAANSSHFAVLRLGKTLRIISTIKLAGESNQTPGAVQMSEFSKDTVVLMRETNDAVTVYACGYTVEHFDLRSPHTAPAKTSRFSRRADDYELSILDHYSECVRFWQRSDHWADRGNRKLRARLGSSHKTELIFHNDLHHWLKTHLEAQVWIHPKDTTHDELDIGILSPTGRSYIVELKWMGINENGTSYAIKTVKKGLGQLRAYLTKQAKVVRGTLVAYDGREKVLFDALVCIANNKTEGCKRLGSCEGADVPPRGSCLVLFLEHETASQQ